MNIFTLLQHGMPCVHGIQGHLDDDDLRTHLLYGVRGSNRRDNFEMPLVSGNPHG